MRMYDSTKGGENVMYSLLRMRIAILYEFWLTQDLVWTCIHLALQ